MFSKLFKLTFVITAYSPILLIWWVVGIFTTIDVAGKTQILNFSEISIERLIIKCYLVLIFIFLIIFCWSFLHLAKTRLTINTIEVKSIKSADFNMNTLIFSYFLPCIELFKKDIFFIFGWIIILLVIIFINKNTYFYNPLMKLFGYRYYEIATKKEVWFTLISKRKLINSNEIKTYSQLTDYVIIDANKN